MLTLRPATADKPYSGFVCSKCERPITMTLHQDGLTGACCGETYLVPFGLNLRNCCSFPELLNDEHTQRVIETLTGTLQLELAGSYFLNAESPLEQAAQDVRASRIQTVLGILKGEV